MTMDKISEAVLDKVKAESDAIIREAEEKAGERVQKAREQYNARLEAEKTRLLAEAGSEASRILAQASINVRQELLRAKNEVIDEIVSRLKQKLADTPDRAARAVALIREGLQAIEADEVTAYVSPADIDGVKELIKKDKELSSAVREVKETNCIGGAKVEDIDGRFTIDNTYDTRLETLLPRILPEISKELFGQ
jgi:vacuolar-type H+-ATPase subunit E/Vma4